MLSVHFQVASLNPPKIPKVISGGEPTVLWEFVLRVALSLLGIFPRIGEIEYPVVVMSSSL